MSLSKKIVHSLGLRDEIKIVSKICDQIKIDVDLGGSEFNTSVLKLNLSFSSLFLFHFKTSSHQVLIVTKFGSILFA